MFTFDLAVLAAAALGVLAAAAALSVAAVASLRGGRSTTAARRLAPVTVAPAIAAFLLCSLALAGTLPALVPLAVVVVVSAAIVPPVRSLWQTPGADAVTESGRTRSHSRSGAD